MLRITLRSAKRRMSRLLLVNAPALKTGWLNRLVVAVVTDEPGVGQALLEPLDDRVAGRVVAAERDDVVVVEVHAVGAELGQLLQRVDGVHRRPGGAAERVDALPADGPQTEGELVVGARGGDLVCVPSQVGSDPGWCGRGARRSARGRRGWGRPRPRSRGWASAAARRRRRAPRRPGGRRRARRTPPDGGTSTGRPRTAGARARTAALRAAPPTISTRRGAGTGAPASSSTASAREHRSASNAARARSARVVEGRRPVQVPMASGRLGVRSPP